MKRFLFILTLTLTLCMLSASAQSIYTAEDSPFYLRIWNRTHGSIVPVSQYLLDTPYVGGTLEGNETERLVVNLRQVDCTTLVEQVIAIHLSEGTFASFCEQLQLLRYDEGHIDGYASRLHYFSAWIANAEQMGVARNITNSLGGIPLGKSINFMTTHPDLYAQLADASTLAAIKEQEDKVNQLSLCYIPKQQIPFIEKDIQPGDIIAITCATEGLDITHVGIAAKDGHGDLCIIHASSTRRRVTFSTPLAEYLNGNDNFTGIIVTRLLK